MVRKKLHFPTYILWLALLLVLQSCEKNARTSVKKPHNLTEINSLIEVAHKHNKNQEFDSSFYYFSKAKYATELKKDTSSIIHSLAWMSQIQCNQGDYYGSETTNIEAFPFIESSSNYSYGETNIYIGLGNNYLFTFDNNNAISYFKKAINSKTDKDIKSDIKNNISTAYTKKGDYQKAIQILLPMVLKKELLNYPETFARINDNLGHAYNKSENPKAFYCLNQGLKIRQQIKDNRGIISSYYNLSEYYKGATRDNLKLKNGLQNVENRTHAIKGTTTFDAKSEKGFKVTFIFPI